GNWTSGRGDARVVRNRTRQARQGTEGRQFTGGDVKQRSRHPRATCDVKSVGRCSLGGGRQCARWAISGSVPWVAFFFEAHMTPFLPRLGGAMAVAVLLVAASPAEAQCTTIGGKGTSGNLDSAR